MSIEANGDQNEKLSILQKILLGSLYFLIILMIVFSVMAVKNVGMEGFNKCMEKKCAQYGEAFCNKYREINNCCSGAGGNVAQTNEGLKCIFE